MPSRTPRAATPRTGPGQDQLATAPQPTPAGVCSRVRASSDRCDCRGVFSGGDAFRVPGSDALDGIDRVVDRQVHHGQVSGGMHRRRLNAGTGDSEMLVDTSYDEWRKIIATNLDGTFVCMRQAAKHMVKTAMAAG